MPVVVTNSAYGSLVHHDDRTQPHFGRPTVEQHQAWTQSQHEHCGYDSSGMWTGTSEQSYPINDDNAWNDAALTPEQAWDLAHGHNSKKSAAVPLNTQVDSARYFDAAGVSPITDGASDDSGLTESPRSTGHWNTSSQLMASYSYPLRAIDSTYTTYGQQQMQAYASQSTMQYTPPQYTHVSAAYTQPLAAHAEVPRAMLGSVSPNTAMASVYPSHPQSPTAPLVVPQPRHIREDASNLLQRYVGRPPTPERTYAAHRNAVFTAPSEYYNWQPALARGIRPEQLAMTIAPAVLESGSPVTPNPVVEIHPRSSTTEISVRPADVDVPGGVKRRKKTPEPRKPMMMACLFCRGRKIACGAPALGAADRTCDQCRKRGIRCEYPKECKRGHKRLPAKEATPPMTQQPSPTTDNRITVPSVPLRTQVEGVSSYHELSKAFFTPSSSIPGPRPGCQ